MFNASSAVTRLAVGVRRVRSLGLVAALVIAGTGYVVPANAVDLPDAWITTTVKMALLLAEDVPATAVIVDTTNGNVTRSSRGRT